MTRLQRASRNPLTWLGLCLVVGFAILQRAGDEFDLLALIVISITYTLAVVSMVVRTGWSRWSTLGAGLLATMAGDALFYTYILTGTHPLPFRVLHHEETVVLVRDLFLIGGVFVSIGLAKEVWGDRTGSIWHRLRPGRNRRDQEGASS